MWHIRSELVVSLLVPSLSRWSNNFFFDHLFILANRPGLPAMCRRPRALNNVSIKHQNYVVYISDTRSEKYGGCLTFATSNTHDRLRLRELRQ